MLDSLRFGLPVRGEGTVQPFKHGSVYTPPGYDGKRRFPTLYVLGDHDAKPVLDAALARDAAKPMVVVIARSGRPDDVVEAVERRFRVERSRNGRAIAGGADVLATNDFGHVSLWGAGSSGRIARFDDTRLELRIGRDDPAYAAMTATRARLDRAGVEYEYTETAGATDRERYLRELVPRLFRETEFIEP